jgi:Tfp pilus assembly protein PilF
MEAEKRDQQICELVDQYLPEEVEDIHIQKIMAYHAAKAYYQRGHYDEAEQLINNYSLIGTQDNVGLILFYQVQWARGEKQQTINDLEAILNRRPNSTRIISLLVSLYFEGENYDRVRQLVILESLNAPSDLRPKLDLLRLAAMEEDGGEVEDQFDRLFQNYGADEEALMRLAEFAAWFGLVEKSKKMYLQAHEGASNKDVLAILLLRSYMKSGAYRQGIEFASTLSNLVERLQLYRDSYLSCYYYALNEDALAELHLKSFLQFANKRALEHLSLALDLITIGRQEIALELLHKALELDGSNQAVLVEALKLELELADLRSIQVRLEAYLKTRRPDKALLQTCYDKLVGDRFMFERDRAYLLRKLRADL